MPREVKWAISLAVGLGLLALGWKVYFMLVTLHVVICGLLIIVIMLQSGEAADLAGAFGAPAARRRSARAELPHFSPRPQRGAPSCSCSRLWR